MPSRSPSVSPGDREAALAESDLELLGGAVAREVAGVDAELGACPAARLDGLQRGPLGGLGELQRDRLGLTRAEGDGDLLQLVARAPGVLAAVALAGTQ